MDITPYFYFVIALSIIYVILIRIIQSKLMDSNMMKSIQEKSKQINELYKEAAKNNNKRKMDEISKMNEELMPMMNKLLMSQMKMMVVIIGIFIAFTWVTGYADPTLKDDFSINLTKTNNSDNIYSGSFVLKNATQNFWYATIVAYNNRTEIAMNQTVFFVGQKTDELLWIQTKASQMPVHTDKETYSSNSRVMIYATVPTDAHDVVATFNSGTRFYVDLPVTIPLINLRRIYDSQSWFIFSAIIIGLLINPLVLLIKKYILKK